MSPSEVVQRAERRAIRRRTGARFGAAALAVAGVGVAVVLVGRGEPARRAIPAAVGPSTDASSLPEPTGPTAGPSTGGQSAAEPAALDWAASDLGADSPVADVHHTVTGDGPLFAWTADEQSASNFVSSLRWSADGSSWQPVPASPDLAILAASASSTRIVVLGYVPSEDAGSASDVVVKISDDGGTVWRTVPFPVDIPARPQAGALIGPAPAGVAVVGETVVVSFGVQASPLELADPTGQATTDLPSAVPSQVYVSTGDEPFEAVSGGPVSTSQFSQSIIVSESDGEFLALSPGAAESDGPGSTFWQSVDGRSWTTLGTAPVQDPSAATIGRAGSVYVVAATEGVWLSLDGAEWQQKDFADTLPVPYAAAAGVNGITVVGVIPGPARFVDVAKDGVIARTNDSFTDVTFYDEATGAELWHLTENAPFENDVVRALGDGKIDVLDDTGAVRATFTVDDLSQALIAAPRKAQQQVILHSDDGVAWSSTSINELTAGEPIDVRWVSDVDGAATIGIGVETSDDPARPSPHLYLLTGTRV